MRLGSHAAPFDFSAFAAASHYTSIGYGKPFSAVLAPHMKRMATIAFTSLEHDPAGIALKSRGLKLTPKDAAPIPAGLSIIACAEAWFVKPSVFVKRVVKREKTDGNSILRAAQRGVCVSGGANDEATGSAAVLHHALERFHITHIHWT